MKSASPAIFYQNSAKDYAVVPSEARYRELEKAERNAAYLHKIEQSWEDVRAGNVIIKTFDELKAMQRELESVDA